MAKSSLGPRHFIEGQLLEVLKIEGGEKKVIQTDIGKIAFRGIRN